MKSHPLIVMLILWRHRRERRKRNEAKLIRAKRGKSQNCHPSLIRCRRLPLQVFATYPNEDYDRRNEDVDPMAASAEYELEKRVERLDLFPVELEKGRSLLPNYSTNV